MANNPKNVENLKPFKKGDDERRHMTGRPRKFVTALKEQGYKACEVNDTMMALLSMTMDELKDVYTSPESTVLEKACANAIHTSIKRGSLYNIESILSRTLGKPKETQDLNLGGATSLKVEVVDTGVAIARSEKDITD